VLTLERVGGIRVDDRKALIEAGHDIRAIMANAAGAFFNQVFRDGFFHADLHPGNLFIDVQGAIVVVDFGIMGRVDRKTRYYLADMLLAFLTGDYRRVAEVHFEAGYVPARQSLEAFAQACRSIGEPILGRPINEISLGRLLAQLFQVTEQFQMETQPQLLLLQKTMVLAEGVGRMLDPEVNMWTLARPLIEEWMRANRGPEARMRDAAADTLAVLERLPGFFRDIERLGAAITEGGGLPLHPDTLAEIARRDALELLGLPLWIVALALAAIAIAVW
jgi:ubiquinone biosynthesis protein